MGTVWLTIELKILHEYEKIMSFNIMVRQRASIFHQLTCSMGQLKSSSKYYRNVIPINIQQNFHNIHQAHYSVCSVCYQTHYETLGLERNATPKEIKDAYIKLGKELHPDLHQKDEIEQGSDDISIEKEKYTAKFKSLNEAYSVLSKPDAKRIYDLSLPGQHKDKTSRRYRHYEPLGNTFEERAGKVYGYQVDQNYWNADSRARKKRVVIYCIIWAVFGAIVQITLVRYATKRQQKQDKERHIETTRHLERKQKEALSRPNLKEKENGEYDRLIELYKSKSVSRE